MRSRGHSQPRTPPPKPTSFVLLRGRLFVLSYRDVGFYILSVCFSFCWKFTARFQRLTVLKPNFTRSVKYGRMWLAQVSPLPGGSGLWIQASFTFSCFIYRFNFIFAYLVWCLLLFTRHSSAALSQWRCSLLLWDSQGKGRRMTTPKGQGAKD